MIKIMAATETPNHPGITLSDGELIGMLGEVLDKLGTVVLDLAEISGQLARLDGRFSALEAEVKPLLDHPWVAKFRNRKAAGRGPFA